jgi:hypothetical protein
MSDSPSKPASFRPPPHTNAEAHAKVMAKLDQMTTSELRASMVKAGVYTPDGKALAEQYRDSENK